MKRLLDASNVNPASLEQVRESGAVGLLWKATQAAGFKDATLAAGRKIAATLKIPFGSYLFLDPRVDGAAQAAFYLAYAKPKPGDIGPAIDTELAAGKTPAEIAACVQGCAAALEAKGYRPLLYGSTSWLQGLYAELPVLRRLRVWEADYPGPGLRVLPVAGQRLLAALRRRLRLGRGVSVVAWQATSVWQVKGHGFDGSYLLAPLDTIRIPAKPATVRIPKPKTAAPARKPKSP
jgi:GH25 family lysozyme M1 (1,4-beta-N-acetylmuramidase)